MKKQHLQQYVITGVVILSLFSFIFLNFFSTPSISVKGDTRVETAVERVEKENEDNDDSGKAAPKLAIIGYLFEVVQNVIPSTR